MVGVLGIHKEELLPVLSWGLGDLVVGLLAIMLEVVKYDHDELVLSDQIVDDSIEG